MAVLAGILVGGTVAGIAGFAAVELAGLGGAPVGAGVAVRVGVWVGVTVAGKATRPPGRMTPPNAAISDAVSAR
jgi:hypothetical protein